MLGISTLGRLRQEDFELEASLGNRAAKSLVSGISGGVRNSNGCTTMGGSRTIHPFVHMNSRTDLLLVMCIWDSW